MGFGDLKTDAGQKALDNFLADKSYIEGFQPSQADAVVFAALSKAPAQTNALRWYNHIKSYSNTERSKFPGNKKSLDSYGSSSGGAAAQDDDDEDIDLFGSDDDDDAKAEADALREKRLAEYAAKKSKKPAAIAKSNVILDVKPWDDETSMKDIEEKVRSVTMDGLLWGSSKLVPVGYGIKKLQISMVIEDEKVSLDELQEIIEGFEDHVQSTDIAAFNKI